MKRLLDRAREDSGLSLIEVIVATGLAMVVLAAALQSLTSATKHEAAQAARHEALLDLRSALNRISRDIRQATTIYPICASPVVLPCSSRSRLEFDTLSSGIDVHVVYQVTGDVITRSISTIDPDDVVHPTGTSMTLSDRVASPTPFCYDPPDCALPGPPLEPAQVRINLALEPVKDGTGSIRLATDVNLRNL